MTYKIKYVPKYLSFDSGNFSLVFSHLDYWIISWKVESRGKVTIENFS